MNFSRFDYRYLRPFRYLHNGDSIQRQQLDLKVRGFSKGELEFMIRLVTVCAVRKSRLDQFLLYREQNNEQSKYVASMQRMPTRLSSMSHVLSDL